MTTETRLLGRGIGVLRFAIALLVLVNYTPGAMGNCNDTLKTCFASSMEGKCDESYKNYLWQRKKCPVSCEQCDPVVVPRCQDTDPKMCKLWARENKCTRSQNRRFMRLHCAESCGERGAHCFPSGGRPLAARSPRTRAPSTRAPSSPTTRAPSQPSARRVFRPRPRRVRNGGGGMSDQERTNMENAGHTDDPNNRFRHSDWKYYALPSLVQTSRSCYPGQNTTHKVKALVFVDDMFCSDVNRGTYRNRSRPSCEDEARKVLEQVSAIFENTLNLRFEVARVKRLNHPYGCAFHEMRAVFDFANRECRSRVSTDNVGYGLCPLLSGCSDGWKKTVVRGKKTITSQGGGTAIMGGLCGWSRASVSSSHAMPLFYTTLHEIGHLFDAAHTNGHQNVQGIMNGGSSGYVTKNNRYYYGFNDDSVREMCAKLSELKRKGGRDNFGKQCLTEDNGWTRRRFLRAGSGRDRSFGRALRWFLRSPFAATETKEKLRNEIEETWKQKLDNNNKL